MDDLLHRKEGVQLHQVLENRLIGLLGGNAGKLPRLGGHAALVIHRHHHRNFRVMVHADLKVLHAVAGGGVDAAGAAFQGDVLPQDDGRDSIHKGMGIGEVFQLPAGDEFRDGVLGDAAGLHGGGHQLPRHHIVFVLFGGVDHAVVVIRPQTDSQVAGEGPGGGGPNDEVGFCQVRPQGGELPLVIRHLEFHIDGIAGVLGVLNLRLRQGGFALGAPVHRL